MTKLTLALVTCCLLLTEILGNPNENYLRLHQTCLRVYEKCKNNKSRLGNHDDTSIFFNEFCRSFDLGWLDASRCELLRIACFSTVRDCESPTCKNVARQMRERKLNKIKEN
ncbi:uncharacterized protein LOC108118176 [Drosophila eugracilis]|uniref:uncharacterized protein LOC108118176 n=1 Tax=Drosophila eugracilis TaxID=29029 RepID=UPI0007E5E249|nr:uncharacterized protein LOC108118176 [Drosophila eugracilis]